jgi:hypothetical protein
VEGNDEEEYTWSGTMAISAKLLRSEEGVIQGDRRKKVGSGTVVLRRNEQKEILKLCGDVMLSGQKYEPVELEDFNFGEYVDVEVKDGRVLIVGICVPELSQVEKFLQLSISVKEVGNGEQLGVGVYGEMGREYRLRIYNVIGRVVEEVRWEKTYEEETILLEAGKYGKGLFIIEVTNGEQIARAKFVRY